MVTVQIEIAAWLEDHFPGFVRCHLLDRYGRQWRFDEKVPVVTDRNLTRDAPFPQTGAIVCTIVSRRLEGSREIVVVDTSQPWGIESIEGVSTFEIWADQLVEL